MIRFHSKLRGTNKNDDQIRSFDSPVEFLGFSSGLQPKTKFSGRIFARSSRNTASRTIDLDNEAATILGGLLKYLVTNGSTMTAGKYIIIDSHTTTFNRLNNNFERRVVIFENSYSKK